MKNTTKLMLIGLGLAVSTVSIQLEAQYRNNKRKYSDNGMSSESRSKKKRQKSEKGDEKSCTGLLRVAIDDSCKRVLLQQKHHKGGTVYTFTKVLKSGEKPKKSDWSWGEFVYFVKDRKELNYGKGYRWVSKRKLIETIKASEDNENVMLQGRNPDGTLYRLKLDPMFVKTMKKGLAYKQKQYIKDETAQNTFETRKKVQKTCGYFGCQTISPSDLSQESELNDPGV